MSKAGSQAVQRYRARLSTQGIARFEVIGRAEDRVLIRALARRLAEPTADADRLREAVSRSVEESTEPSPAGRATGGILSALRASPLVGANLELARTPHAGRDSGL